MEFKTAWRCFLFFRAAVIEKIGVNDVDDAYERVVAGDVKFRFVIDTATFDD